MSRSTALSSGLLAAGTTTLVSRKSFLNSVSVNSDGTNAATVVVYDNTAGSGKVLAKLVTGTSGTLSMTFNCAVRADIGITVVVSGTGTPQAVVTYDAA